MGIKKSELHMTLEEPVMSEHEPSLKEVMIEDSSKGGLPTIERNLMMLDKEEPLE